MRQELPTTYYVWRRVSPTHPDLDGYVGVTTYDPNSTNFCDRESYDLLLVTEDFIEAQRLTVSEQAKDERYNDD